MADFKETLEISANGDGTYSYCKAKYDLALEYDAIPIEDFDDKASLMKVLSLMSPYSDSDRHLIKLASKLMEYGWLNLWTEY